MAAPGEASGRNPPKRMQAIYSSEELELALPQEAKDGRPVPVHHV